MRWKRRSTHGPDNQSLLEACSFRQTEEVLSFQCRPTLKALVGQLENVRKHFGGAALKLCHEASYVGFSLQRDLQDRGYPCVVVSPSSIPRRAGKSVKTDRIDAAELAEFYANGLLTVVAPPDAEFSNGYRPFLAFDHRT